MAERLIAIVLKTVILSIVGSNPTLSIASLAQLVEQQFCKLKVMGSIPIGSISCGSLMVKQLAHDELIEGSSPSRSNRIDGRVVECDGLLNHCTISTEGSNPSLSKTMWWKGIHARLKI